MPKSKQTSSPSSDPDIVVNIPSPAGIVAPVKEKPNIVFPPDERVKPASAAEPPDVEKLLKPDISN